MLRAIKVSFRYYNYMSVRGKVPVVRAHWVAIQRLGGLLHIAHARC